VTVSPTTSLQGAFDANPSGTTFCFSPGTYVLTGHVAPKEYDQLISVTPRAAILTGLDTYDGGIVGWAGMPYGHDVLVQGFVIQHFVNPWGTFPRSPLQAGDNWTIRDNEISYNSESGVHLASGSQLVGNFIHDNGRYGFEGGPLTNVLVQNNEVSFNNAAHYDPNNDAGGSKIIESSGVVFQNNWVHDNYGNGLWTDMGNSSVTFENNTLERNYLAGIAHEIGWDAVIRNNTFRGNGTFAVGLSLWYSADLFVYDSQNVEIYGNTIVAGINGITLRDDDRGSDSRGLLQIANDSVHDNTITLPALGTTGMVGNRAAAYTPGNNRFEHNTYSVAHTTAASWIWGSAMTWSQWQGAGNDLTGTLLAGAP